MNERIRMIKELFQFIDKMDVDGASSFYSDSMKFTFGNMPTIEGKDNVKEMVSGFFGGIAAISHALVEQIEKDDTVILRGTVTYTRKDDSQLTVPFCNVFKMKNDKIQEYSTYVDTSELFK